MHKHLTWTDRLKIEKGLKEASKPLVAHLSSASADFCRFYNFKAIKIPENSRFPGFSYICSICSVFGKSDGI